MSDASDAAPDVTQLLVRHRDGDPDALAALFQAVYDELRRIASGYMRRENPGHTLQPTALVNEAYFRLVDQRAVQWQNRAHFYGNARARAADKRGGDVTRLALDEALGVGGEPEVGPDLVALDTALGELARINERQAKVVEMRFFGGLSVEETAEALGASSATVKRDWNFARAFLHKRQSEG
jgi:RNA polymerase sigma factor (TIGR02999 family)